MGREKLGVEGPRAETVSLITKIGHGSEGQFWKNVDVTEALMAKTSD